MAKELEGYESSSRALFNSIRFSGIRIYIAAIIIIALEFSTSPLDSVSILDLEAKGLKSWVVQSICAIVLIYSVVEIIITYIAEKNIKDAKSILRAIENNDKLSSEKGVPLDWVSSAYDSVIIKVNYWRVILSFKYLYFPFFAVIISLLFSIEDIILLLKAICGSDWLWNN